MSISDFQKECPVCHSTIKAERGVVESYYGQKIWCADNWHWVTPPPPAPKKYEWTLEDDAFMSQMDQAFTTPLEKLQERFHYLRS